MTTSTIVIIALCFVASISGICQDDHPNCANFVRNGFCTNSFYANQRYMCRGSCGLCNNCADKNIANCINWVINGFCLPSSAYTPQQKFDNCAASCGFC